MLEGMGRSVDSDMSGTRDGALISQDSDIATHQPQLDKHHRKGLKHALDFYDKQKHPSERYEHKHTHKWRENAKRFWKTYQQFPETTIEATIAHNIDGKRLAILLEVIHESEIREQVGVMKGDYQDGILNLEIRDVQTFEGLAISIKNGLMFDNTERFNDFCRKLDGVAEIRQPIRDAIFERTPPAG